MMNILRWKILGVTIRSCLLLLQSLKGGKDSLEPPYRGGDLGLVRLSTLFQITVPGVGVRWGTQPGFKFRLRWLHKHFASCRWWSTAMPSSVTLGSNATHDKVFSDVFRTHPYSTFSSPPKANCTSRTSVLITIFILIKDFYLIFHSQRHSLSSDHQHCSLDFGICSWLASLLQSCLFSSLFTLLSLCWGCDFPYKMWTHASLSAPLELSAVISIV